MTEPIRLFRDYAQGKATMREVLVNEKLYYVFGEAAYPATTQTALKQLGADKYYTIDSIAYCWKYQSAQHNTYVREVSTRGVESVTLLQKTKLVNYLRGENEELEGVDLNAPAAVPVIYSTLLANAKRERHAERERQEPATKRPRVDESFDSSHRSLDDKAEPMEVDDADKSASQEGIRGLSSTLSAEKVAQLRNRVKRNARSQVRSPSSGDPMRIDGDLEPLADLNVMLDVGDELISILRENELPGCSRVELYSRNSDFDAIHSYFTELQNKHQPQNDARTSSGSQRGPSGRQATGYSRYDQEVFRSEPDADFQIQTDLSFHGTSFDAIRGGTPNAARPTSSQPANGAANMTSNDRGNRRSNFGPRDALNPNGRPPKPTNRRPIIIIPASGTALISMYNAEDILQNLSYVPTEERKKTKRREFELVIHRDKGNSQSAAYQVLDDPRKLRDEDWDRIVAVFVQGPAWQFKGWKYGQQPTEIFSKVCAFHIKFDEQPLDKNVANWSVKVLSLSQTKRHLDRAVLHGFWNTLDRFMVKNKPFLRY